MRSWLLLLFFVPAITFAQNSSNEFRIFFEKAYLHTDRTYYVAGEDLWFKSYLVNAQTGLRINTSHTLYVELLSPANTLLLRQVVRLENGLGQGDFKLPAQLASGNYRLRAYTNWMRNFDDVFVYEKPIQIVALPGGKKKIPAGYNPVFIDRNNAVVTTGTKHLQFFPEGGTFVQGVLNRVAFKATNELGQGIKVHGKILNASGDSVAAIVTTLNGMGSFVFTATQGNYTAVGHYENKENFSIPLPAADTAGYVLSTRQHNEQLSIHVLAGNSATEGLRLEIRCKGRKVWVDSAVSLQNNNYEQQVPLEKLGFGLNIITLYDEQHRPQCERLVYIDNKQAPTLSLKASLSFSDSIRATALLQLTDQLQQSPKANISLSVTDADMIPAANENIVSYLLLGSEVKGDIEQPLQYFDANNAQRKEQLDLLLLVQGWRSFLWRRLQQMKVTIRYMPEPGITLSGKVDKLYGKKGMPGMSVTLYAGGLKGAKYFNTTTNNDGRFYFDGIDLTGTQLVRLSSRNANTFKREGELFLDSLYGKPMAFNSQAPPYIFDTTAISNHFWKNAATVWQRADSLAATRELPNVTVTAKRGAIRLSGDLIMPFGPDSLFKISPADDQYKTLENYVLQKYPMARSSPDIEGFYFLGDGGEIIRPRWIVNNMEDRFSPGNSMLVDEETGQNDGAFDRVDLFNIPIRLVNSVRVTSGVNGNNRRTYVVSLDVSPGALTESDFTIVNALVDGYYEPRQFYEPAVATSFKPVQNTLYWSPMLKTDSTGYLKLKLPPIAPHNLMLSVEGITDSGMPIAATMFIRRKEE